VPDIPRFNASPGEGAVDPAIRRVSTNDLGQHPLTDRWIHGEATAWWDKHLYDGLLGSGLGYVPLVSAPVYSATKAAVHSFTISLRRQLTGSSVQIVEIIPPVVETDHQRGQIRKSAPSRENCPTS